MVVLEQMYPQNLAAIHYHVYWPSPRDPFYMANEEQSRARVEYYPEDELYEPQPSWYVPRIFFDGFLDGRELYEDSTWFNMAADRSQEESPLAITLNFDFDGVSGTVTAHIAAEEDLTFPNVVIHFVMTESEIEYEAGNGVNVHHNVMRKMLPDESGEAFQILNGQTVMLTRDFTLEPEWVPEHVGFVVFVQDNTTREVVQSAASRIMTSVSMIDYDLSDARGDGDGRFEAGETVDLSVALRNFGPPAAMVSATMSSVDPDIMIMRGDVQFEDISLNGTVENKDVPFVFRVSPGVEAHYTILTIDVTANGGATSSRKQIEIIVGKPDILVVNDDHVPPTYPWDYNAERFYQEALHARRETFHVWNTVTTGIPGGTVLDGYETVIWFTGRSDHPAITPEDAVSLTAFLDAGGHLIVSGQDIAADLKGTLFLSDYLHAEFVTDSSSDVRMDPVFGDPITGSFGRLSIDSRRYGAANQDSPDEIRAIGEAVPILTYYDSKKTAALRYMDGYRVVYFSVGFESIVDARDNSNALELRAELLQQILNWFQFTPQIGDVNEDGMINVIDAVWLANIILGLREPNSGQIWAADINEDGILDLIDMISLMNIILGVQ